MRSPAAFSMCADKLAGADKSGVEEAVSGLLGSEVVRVAELAGGRNGRSYRVECRSLGVVVVKFQYRLDRLIAEFTALEFLWGQGFRNIQRPLAMDRDIGCGIYQYIEGDRLQAEDISDAEIEMAASFLQRLWDLGRRAECRSLPMASEACLTVGEIFQTIEKRLFRLESQEAVGEVYDRFRSFIRDQLVPELEECRRWCKHRLGRLGDAWAAPLVMDRMTLSPSDFGFHNALRTNDGKMFFIDLEHFGRDDPAKMAADILLHPNEAMAVRESLKNKLIDRLVAHIDPSAEWLADRIQTVMPLYALKWCTILLNEFDPEHMARREFAVAITDSERSAVLARQLDKVNLMLARSVGLRI